MEKELSDDQIQARLDDAILKAPPEKLTDDELDRRLSIAHQKSFGARTMDAANDVMGAIGTAADYPAGIARSAISNIADYESDKKNGAEALQDFGQSFKGPSHAPTSQDMARRMGVSDLPMGNDYFKPLGDVPQSALAGAAIDMATAYPEAALAGEALGAGGRAARTILGSDDQALKAVGIRAKDIRPTLRVSDYADPYADVGKMSQYAQDNLISPLSSTESTLQRTKQRLEDVGSQIGDIRKKNQGAIDDMLSKYQDNVDKYKDLQQQKYSASPAEQQMIDRQMDGLNKQLPDMKDVSDYLSNTFTPETSMNRISAQIKSNIADPEYGAQVEALVDKKLSALNDKFQENVIPIEDLTKLKSHWQKEVNYGKDAADYSVREDANNLLQKEADRAISNEINFGDNILGGNDLAKHNQLKQEYGLLKTINDGLSAKAAREMTARNGLNPLNHLAQSTGVQSAVASIPDEAPGPLATSGGAAAIGYGNLANMRAGSYKEPYVGGFPMSQTQGIGPDDYVAAKNSVEQSPTMSVIDKAKRLNLLNQFGRVYLGN